MAWEMLLEIQQTVIIYKKGLFNKQSFFAVKNKKLKKKINFKFALRIANYNYLHKRKKKGMVNNEKEKK